MASSMSSPSHTGRERARESAREFMMYVYTAKVRPAEREGDGIIIRMCSRYVQDGAPTLV